MSTSLWRVIVPETRNTMMRRPEASAARRKLPGPRSARVVTIMTRPPRPPGVSVPQPSAPGKAFGAARLGGAGAFGPAAVTVLVAASRAGAEVAGAMASGRRCHGHRECRSDDCRAPPHVTPSPRHPSLKHPSPAHRADGRAAGPYAVRRMPAPLRNRGRLLARWAPAGPAARVEGVEGLAHGLGGEVRPDPLPAPLAHQPCLHRVSQHPQRGLGEAVDVARLRKEPGGAGFDKVGHAVDRRRDDGTARCHRLGERTTQPLVIETGTTYTSNVDGHPRGVVPEPGEQDRYPEPVRLDGGSPSRVLRSPRWCHRPSRTRCRAPVGVPGRTSSRSPAGPSAGPAARPCRRHGHPRRCRAQPAPRRPRRWGWWRGSTADGTTLTRPGGATRCSTACRARRGATAT